MSRSRKPARPSPQADVLLRPAYERVYTNAAEAERDFYGGRDFIIEDGRSAGVYISRRHLKIGLTVGIILREGAVPITFQNKNKEK